MCAIPPGQTGGGGDGEMAGEPGGGKGGGEAPRKGATAADHEQSAHRAAGEALKDSRERRAAGELEIVVAQKCPVHIGG
eukprot:2912780-Prymnesium_polylepis.2